LQIFIAYSTPKSDFLIHAQRFSEKQVEILREALGYRSPSFTSRKSLISL